MSPVGRSKVRDAWGPVQVPALPAECILVSGGVPGAVRWALPHSMLPQSQGHLVVMVVSMIFREHSSFERQRWDHGCRVEDVLTSEAAVGRGNLEAILEGRVVDVLG